jgi:hypothetical protein
MDTRPPEKPLDSDELEYVFRFYGHLMSPLESAASRHLFATAKLTKGRTDLPAQEEARHSSHPIRRDLLSDHPDILQLTRDGREAFTRRAAQRIFNAHRAEIIFNRCPRCGRVAKTPKARQCRFRRHDWHTS